MCGIGVSFFVMVMRKVIEGLDGVARIGVKGDAVFTCAGDVLESV